MHQCWIGLRSVKGSNQGSTIITACLILTVASVSASYALAIFMNMSSATLLSGFCEHHHHDQEYNTRKPSHHKIGVQRKKAKISRQAKDTLLNVTKQTEPVSLGLVQHAYVFIYSHWHRSLTAMSLQAQLFLTLKGQRDKARIGTVGPVVPPNTHRQSARLKR